MAETVLVVNAAFSKWSCKTNALVTFEVFAFRGTNLCNNSVFHEWAGNAPDFPVLTYILLCDLG